ncbi:amidohydrolase family protein [Blastococcus sp. TF02A-26]|uniref:metal-dependent hydrolase family protein n=1 Tax=Blastococcus sp. TF02A-26 TaxID=2250577 RepID=UPI000DEA8197|nr:amidohydrolase family protein [Blastococcus sp. TF02A-26]RBY85998.1 amidohydrolase family protein [Blastococcus sp. TF02A-26]
MFNAESMLLIHGRVFDGTGNEPIPDGGVWIEGDEIRRVGSADQFDDVPDSVPRVDVGGRFVMPGLVESHSHLSYFNASSLQDLDMNCTAEATTIKAVLNARTMLRAGYTSAFSFGSLHAVDVELRRHINSGDIPGPRYVACGRDVLGTGGMVDWNPDHLQLGMDGLALLADNPWEVRKAIRTIRKNGADSVKVYLDGEGMIESDLPGELSYTQEEADAAADEGHRRNLKMICHARSADAVTMALKAGMDVIGHANYLDDEALDRLYRDRHRIFVTPAIHWQVGLYENGAEFGFTSGVLDGLGYKAEIAETINSVAKMKAKGIRILPGGDFGLAWTPHGTYARDLQNFVELFDYTPMEALVAATRDAGAMVDFGGKVGTLEAGKFADIVVVDGDPLTDITVLQDQDKIVSVIQGGRFFHNSMPAGPRFDLSAKPGMTPAEEDRLLSSAE